MVCEKNDKTLARRRHHYHLPKFVSTTLMTVSNVGFFFGRTLYVFAETLCGRKYQSRPNKKYRAAIKTNLHWWNMRPIKIEESAVDWSRRSASVYQTSAHIDEVRCQKLINDKEQNHPVTLPLVATTDLQCLHYSRSYAPQLCFVEHLPGILTNCKTKSSSSFRQPLK